MSIGRMTNMVFKNLQQTSRKLGSHFPKLRNLAQKLTRNLRFFVATLANLT